MSADQLSSVFAALADPTRRAILARLADGEASVLELAKPFAISLPAISRHLKVLARAGLVTRSREAQWRPCKLEPAPLKDASQWLDEYRQCWEDGLDRLENYLKETQEQERLMATATPTTATRQELTLTRTLDAPRELVWKAWTEPARLNQWWGPKGHTTQFLSLDLRPGGTASYSMTAPNWRRMWGRFTYLEITPPEHLKFTISFCEEDGTVIPAPFPGDWPLEIHYTLTLTEKGGKTLQTLVGYPENATAEQLETFTSNLTNMQTGFGASFDLLAQYLTRA